jgi:lipoic acid synthetase
MILGDLCTRSCRFCAVPGARQGRPPDPGEGERLAAAVEELALAYVVLTSVDRDDLADRGAGHYAACIRAIRDRLPGLGVEVLTPDYTGEELRPIAAAAPSVLAHNVETVRSLQGVRDRRASFDKSLETLRAAKSLGVPLTKSSILLGLGEQEEEVFAAMDELRGAEVDILVLGQYLRPSRAQIPPAEYLHPDVFSRYGEEARRRGFSRVVSAPLARTSYHAGEVRGNLEGEVRWKLAPLVASPPLGRTPLCGFGLAATAALPRNAPPGILMAATAAFHAPPGPPVMPWRFEAAGKPAGCKLIRLEGELEGGVIRALSIRGDFFASPEEAFDRVEARLAGVPAAELGTAFDRLIAAEGIEVSGISGAALGELLAGALAGGETA